MHQPGGEGQSRHSESLETLLVFSKDPVLNSLSSYNLRDTLINGFLSVTGRTKGEGQSVALNMETASIKVPKILTQGSHLQISSRLLSDGAVHTSKLDLFITVEIQKIENIRFQYSALSVDPIMVRKANCVTY